MDENRALLKITADDRDFLKWLSERRRMSIMDLIHDAVLSEYFDEIAAYEAESGRRLSGGLWLVPEREKGA